MKKTLKDLFAFSCQFGLMILPLCAVADMSEPKLDGGPYQEVVDGVEWTYLVVRGEASVGVDKYSCAPAISQYTAGEVTVPTNLGGRCVTRIASFAFHDCKKITSVVIPEGVKVVDGYAFSTCTELVSVSFPSTLKTIGAYAFSSCSRFLPTSIPASVDMIGVDAFKDCILLSDNGIVIIDGCVLLVNGVLPSSINIPLGVRLIAGGAFAGHSELEYVMMLDGVSAICDEAFKGCTSLLNVDMPSSLTRIGHNTFSGCGRLYSLLLPKDIVDIGIGAFFDCERLAELRLPGGVTNIGDSAFSGCRCLGGISIPESVKRVGGFAFKNGPIPAFEGRPPEGVDNGAMAVDDVFYYNCEYDDDWLPLIERCSFSKATPYAPKAPALSAGEVQSWVVNKLASEFSLPGEDQEAFCRRFEETYTNDYGAAFLMRNGKRSADGKSLHVWDDFIAGTNPLNLESTFLATIEFEDGTPVVKWSPDLNEDGKKDLRKYATLGCKCIGGTWYDMSAVKETDKPDYRFFKVTVEMK